MTAPDAYKEFDTTSIVSRDTVSFGKVTLRKREVLFAGLAVIALLGVIILAIVLAVEVGNCSSGGSSPMSGSQTGAATDYCTTAQCLKTASYEKSIMDETVDPCSNFYQFACGGYATAYPLSHMNPVQTPVDQILTENVQKVRNLMEQVPEREEEHSYERKLRHFISSCDNHFDKMLLRGGPFVDKIINGLGGWIVLGKWNASSFSLQEQLKKVHADFWTAAIFNIRATPDTYDWNKRVIELDDGGLGLPYMYYFPNSSYVTVYKQYMTILASYVARDARVPNVASLIQQFVNDALDVELSLVDAIRNSPYQNDPHAPANRMTLGALNQLTDNTLNFVDYFNYAFPGLPTPLTESTGVSVVRQGFFHNLGPKLKNYTSSDEGKRKLHNYFVWQLINRYAPFLSWDYVHTVRQMRLILYREKDASSGFIECWRQALTTMTDAVGAVFVKEFVNKRDKEEATDIVNTLKQQMMDGLKNVNWMSSENKNDAITKIKDSLYKIGYPDFMADEAYMDTLYSVVNISDIDYLSNVLALNQIRRRRFRDILVSPDSKAMWGYHIMNPVVEYYNPWRELIATAAVFQPPLFAHNAPAYYNYGGMGTVMAASLFNAVDEYGSSFKLDQSNRGNWWTNFTQDQYREIKECAINAQMGQQLGPYNVSGSEFKPNMTTVATWYSVNLLTDVSGLKLSLQSYRAKLGKAGTEKIPAGFTQYSLDRMFFVAFAQAHCENIPKDNAGNSLKYFIAVPSEYKVNLAVSQVQEFREAFQCKQGAPMTSEKTCSLI